MKNNLQNVFKEELISSVGVLVLQTQSLATSLKKVKVHTPQVVCPGRWRWEGMSSICKSVGHVYVGMCVPTHSCSSFLEGDHFTAFLFEKPCSLTDETNHTQKGDEGDG